MELTTIAWLWVGIMIGAVFGVLTAGILASKRQADLEIELYEGRAVREALKDEIFRLENQPKPKPRKRRKRA